jgi:hypothetical protein
VGSIEEFKPGRQSKKKGAQDEAGVPPEQPPDETPAWGECPIVVLGQRQGVYYFLSPSGEFRALTFQQLTTNGIASLFDGDVQGIEEHFPAYDRQGKVVGFDGGLVSAWLMKQARLVGLFNPSTPVRGPGVWPDDESGLIVHCGDKLITVEAGEQYEQPAGCVRDGVIYAAAPKLPPPSMEPATIEEVNTLRAGLGTWRYELGDLGPDIVLGWMASALLGGATDWRIHMMIKGPRGIGKSGLTTFVSSALGAAAQPNYNDFSEAGLRQSMTGEARAIMLDESESEERGASRVAAVITLIRRMSSGEGARSLRGSSSHVSHSFTVTGSAWLSAILQPPLKPQDRSRIIELFLEPLPRGKDGAAGAENVRSLYQLARELSPKLRARAVLGWDRHRETLAIYRRAFLDAGLDIREADKVAAILAGRDLLLQDTSPDPLSVAQDLERFAVLVSAAHADEDEGEGQECMTRLFSSPMEVYRGGERRTVGQVMMAAVGRAEDDLPQSPAQRALEGIGIKVVISAAGIILKIANQHVGLERIFAGTRWEDGKWRDAFHYLPGALPGGREQFAGAQSRCTQLNETYLPAMPPKREVGDPKEALG